MGVIIKKIEGYFEGPSFTDSIETKQQVFSLAQKSLDVLLKNLEVKECQQIIVSTSCPDQIAPSLGQLLMEKYNAELSEIPCMDIVQGCSGGVSALILASQLSEVYKKPILIVASDAAKKATSKSKKIHTIFGNGSFACLVDWENSNKRFIHSKFKQYKGLEDVVTIKLGHDADEIIKLQIKDMASDPRKHLGLDLSNLKAIKLLSKAEKFFQDFIAESCLPDAMILHQVNPKIINHLKNTFEKYKIKFIDVSSLTGNCGSASVGIALNLVKNEIQGKKIMLCSFGTGGIISAGMWQF